MQVPDTLPPPLSNFKAFSVVLGLVTAMQLPESYKMFSDLASPDLPEVDHPEARCKGATAVSVHSDTASCLLEAAAAC